MLSCDDFFYQTTYKRFFDGKKPDGSYAKRASPIQQQDPTLISGHSANNLQINGEPLDTRTWQRPAIDAKPEEYLGFVEKLKTDKEVVYARYFSNPKIDLKPTLDKIKDTKLSTYSSSYSSDYYVARKEDLKWRRLRYLDTSMFKYQETMSNIFYSRVDEIPGLRKLAKPSFNPYDETELKRELREITKTQPSMYYLHYCDAQVPRMNEMLMAGERKKPPLDRYTNRTVGFLVKRKKEVFV